jgi:hypothetical protein
MTARGVQHIEQLRTDMRATELRSGQYADKYTNWNTCASYLSSFEGIKVLDVGRVRLSWSVHFPNDFDKLPITVIQSLLYQGGLPELPRGLEKLSLSRFDDQLPRLPDSLKKINLKRFTRDFPNIPLNLKIFVNAGGRQNLKDLRQNNTVCNLKEQVEEQNYSKK